MTGQSLRKIYYIQNILCSFSKTFQHHLMCPHSLPLGLPSSTDELDAHLREDFMKFHGSVKASEIIKELIQAEGLLL